MLADQRDAARVNLHRCCPLDGIWTIEILISQNCSWIIPQEITNFPVSPSDDPYSLLQVIDIESWMYFLHHI
jgi:hypothetical protein